MKRKNVLLYLGIFFLTAFICPIASEIYDDVVYQPHPGIVDSSTIKYQNSPGHQGYLPSILYSYRVGENTFKSERFFGSANQPSFSTKAEAENFLADLPEGSTCIVYVHPSKPAKSFLKKLYQQPAAFYLNELLGFTISGALIIIATVSPLKAR